MSKLLFRDLVAGGLAGLVGGLVFWWALEAQDMTSTVPGLIGISLSPSGVVFHLLGAILLGAVFGALDSGRQSPRCFGAAGSAWTGSPLVAGRRRN